MAEKLLLGCLMRRRSRCKPDPLTYCCAHKERTLQKRSLTFLLLFAIFRPSQSVFYSAWLGLLQLSSKDFGLGDKDFLFSFYFPYPPFRKKNWIFPASALHFTSCSTWIRFLYYDVYMGNTHGFLFVVVVVPPLCFLPPVKMRGWKSILSVCRSSKQRRTSEILSD